ncbi:hypothetical protein HAX54_033184 [Datura stramonium]|uniref:Uncharacterized protein n=1 Tax=Datura stramonium TaxID=4076 RepID=A0ABS8VEW7_DATST|nr:hypothetical protein [Datura stramonium]
MLGLDRLQDFGDAGRKWRVCGVEKRAQCSSWWFQWCGFADVPCDVRLRRALDRSESGGLDGEFGRLVVRGKRIEGEAQVLG